MKTLPECMSFLTHLEGRLPVNEWTLDGVRVWPLIRTILFHHLNLSLRGPDAPPPGTPLSAKIARLADAFFARWKDPDRNLPREAAAEVFVLTYAGARQTRLDGAYVDVRTGPLIDALASRNIACHAWEYAVPQPYRFPRRNPTHLVQREFYRARLLPRRAVRDVGLPGYQGFCDALRERDALCPELLENRLLREFGLILSLRDRFERAFDVINPAVAFTSNMGRYEFALHLACRRRNIFTVEVQHGAFALHGQYASWRRVPAEGYDLLPRAFWCWDEPTAALLNEWSRRCAPHHQAFAGGNPWMEACAALAPSTPAATEGRKTGLLTLQPPERIYADGGTLPGFVLEAISRLGHGWTWWVRGHPAWPCDTTALAGEFRRRGLSAEFDSVRDAPLPHLLTRADLHLSHSSSTVLEAEQAGLGSVVWSETGAGLYAAQVAAGSCGVATDAESLVREIGRMASAKRTPPPAAGRTAETLERFLELGRATRARSRARSS